jgi:hypothetical protein
MQRLWLGKGRALEIMLRGRRRNGNRRLRRSFMLLGWGLRCMRLLMLLLSLCLCLRLLLCLLLLLLLLLVLNLLLLVLLVLLLLL